MASDLSPLWEQGGEPVGAGPKDDESDAGSKAKSKASSKSKPKATRAKRGQGANLSTGFNNWKHTPETCLSRFGRTFISRFRVSIVFLLVQPELQHIRLLYY